LAASNRRLAAWIAARFCLAHRPRRLTGSSKECYRFARTKNLAEKIEALRQKRGGRAPRRNGHILLLRLTPRKGDTLRFLYNPSVPFTNNQAERDGRMMKGPSENLRPVPFAGGRDRLCGHPLLLLDRRNVGSLSAFR
jgi:hypothetical protein